MIFSQFILEKIKPFIDSFDLDLKSKLDAIDRELSAKGSINSGTQIERHQSEFLDLLSELINKIAEIIFSYIKNKQLERPKFPALQNSIEQLLMPCINQFRKNFEIEIRRLIPKKESATGVIDNFYSTLKNQLDKQFIDIEKNLNRI